MCQRFDPHSFLLCIRRHSWAEADNDEIMTCDASIEVRCSLYKQYLEGSYFCYLEPDAEKQEVQETSDLDCATLDDDSIECIDLTTAQNAAAVNLFMLCATLAVLAVTIWYRDRAVEARNLLLASTVATFAACLCAFISAGSYRNYLEAVTTVDLYYDPGNGEEQEVGTLDMEWSYGYSWSLTILSGAFSITYIFTAGYLWFTDYFNDKTSYPNATRGGIDELPAVRNTLGVPVM